MPSAQATADLVSNVVNQFIVKPLALLNTKGVSGFVFDILADEEMIIDSEITDHYVEDNYAIEDHISLRPLRFMLRGFVAELNDVLSKNDNLLPNIISSLITVDGFLPSFTTQASQVYSNLTNVSQKTENAIGAIANVYSLVNQFSTFSNKQQSAYNFFYSMWVSRQLCTVETPWGVYTNMAIENIRTMQNESTRVVTDFAITFKQIRTTSTLISASNQNSNNPDGSGTLASPPANLANRAGDMVSGSVSQGLSLGQPFSADVLDTAFANGVF